MAEMNEAITGNAAKMLEALEAVDDAFSNGSLYASGDCPTPHDVSVFEDVRDKVKAALAAPPRNCDVGTVEEQGQRFELFCYQDYCNEKCPLYGKPKIGGECGCAIAWAQMPYKKGGEK